MEDSDLKKQAGYNIMAIVLLQKDSPLGNCNLHTFKVNKMTRGGVALLEIPNGNGGVKLIHFSFYEIRIIELSKLLSMAKTLKDSGEDEYLFEALSCYCEKYNLSAKRILDGNFH